MPEGPSIVILKEECSMFKGQKVKHVEGNSKAGIERINNQKVIDFKSYGKNFLICFKSFTVRIHLMLFGSYRINERKEIPVRLSLQFDNGELNFYSCVVEILNEKPDDLYDWQLDVMSPAWNADKVISILNENPKELACDALLNQHIFAGVGNIIKNEVLYRIKMHPESIIKDIPARKVKELVQQAHVYSFDFYTWKKAFELKKHWLVHKQKICMRCNIPISSQIMGKTKRRTYFCSNCQQYYSTGTEIVNKNTKTKDMSKYGEKAQEKVEKAMHERKEGTLKSGRSGKKVTSKKQAIAIGLSEARKAGGKVPAKTASKKSAAKKVRPNR